MAVLTPKHGDQGVEVLALPTSLGRLRYLGLPLRLLLGVDSAGDLSLILDLGAPLSHERVVHHLDICDPNVGNAGRVNRRKFLSRGHLDLACLICRRFLVGCIDKI